MFNQLNPFPYFKVKGSSEVFSTIKDAVVNVRKLSINHEYKIVDYPKKIKEFEKLLNQFKKTNSFSRSTLFNEIEAVSILNNKMLRFINIKPNKKLISKKQFINKMYESLYLYIERNWDSSKTHFMLHSSGFDSRVISGILSKLKNKHGMKWIGKIYFFCYQPDVNYFKNIIEYEGWDDNNIIICVNGNGNNLNDYISESVDFNTICNWVSDTKLTWPDYYISRTIKDLGHDKDNICIVSGLFRDEVGPATTGKLHEFMIEYMLKIRHQLSGYEILLPYTSLPILKVFNNYKIDNFKNNDIKIELSKFIDPKLASFPNYDNKKYRKSIRRTKQRAVDFLSKEVRIKMTHDFKKSWYYKKSKLNIDVIPEFHVIDNNIRIIYDEYIKASICEDLIRKGHIIKF